MGRTIRTTKNRTAVLDALAAGDTVQAACDAVGIGKRSFYDWRHADPDFDAAVETALDQGAEPLLDEARRRALDGSDVLLMFLIKGRRPRYRESYKHEVSGPNGAPLVITFAQRTDGPQRTDDDQ